MSEGSAPPGPQAASKQAQKVSCSWPCSQSSDTKRIGREWPMPLVATFTELYAWDEEGGSLSAA